MVIQRDAGDGIDERDQHLSFAPNTLSVEEWDATFGKVYGGLIEAGLPSIMAGHIALPEYVSYFKKDATIQERQLPATLSKYILTDLLRGKLNFNGVVVTDASHMLGMTATMKRKDILPTAIAAGCDLFLFFNDPDEDFAWMMEGYKNGVITEERLEEALREEAEKNKNLLEEKITKIKSTLATVLQKVDEEAKKKKEKGKYADEYNSKLFIAINTKNKELANELQKTNDINSNLKKEVKQLENIVLKQEYQIKNYRLNSIMNMNNKSMNNKSMKTRVSSQKYLFKKKLKSLDDNSLIGIPNSQSNILPIIY